MKLSVLIFNTFDDKLILKLVKFANVGNETTFPFTTNEGDSASVQR